MKYQVLASWFFYIIKERDEIFYLQAKGKISSIIKDKLWNFVFGK